MRGTKEKILNSYEKNQRRRACALGRGRARGRRPRRLQGFRTLLGRHPLFGSNIGMSQPKGASKKGVRPKLGFLEPLLRVSGSDNRYPGEITIEVRF